MLKKTLKEHGLPLASASAVAIFAFGVPGDVQAGFGGSFLASEILTTINPPNPDGSTQYDYTVVNNSGDFYGGGGGAFLVDWEIPYNPNGFFQVETDGNGLIVSDNVLSPEATDWVAFLDEIGVSNPSHAWGGIAQWLTPGDPWNDFLLDASAGLHPLLLPAAIADELLAATHVIHWAIPPDFFSSELTCDGHPVLGNDVDPDCFWGWGDFEDPVPLDAIDPYGGSLGGFGLVDVNSFEAVAAPYQASWVFFAPPSWVFFAPQTGDPPIPGGPPSTSPFAPTSLTAQPSATPEPGSLALVATGLIGGALVARSRRRRKLQS